MARHESKQRNGQSGKFHTLPLDTRSSIEADLSACGCFEMDGTAPQGLCLAWGDDPHLPELLICVVPARIVGGPRHGEVVPRTFRMHVERLLSLFDGVAYCIWDPMDAERGLWFACLSVAGYYQGVRLSVRVLNTPPENVEPEPMTEKFDPA